ncbi:MAG: hypothetical protein WC714_23955 [Candidatus Obscuribacterales bacterium]|jgi:hypothetical protein
MKVFNLRQPVRSNHGSATAEFGPALGILLICFFFPLLNMLTLAVSYCLCMVLNYNQVHEASLVHMSEAVNISGPVCKGITDNWLAGMGKFVKTDSYPQTSVSYRDGQTTGSVTDRIAEVQTIVVCQPLLNIPIPGLNVPGLNAPMAFSMSSESTMENPDNAPMAMDNQGGQNQNAKTNSSGGVGGAGGNSNSSFSAQAKPLPRGGWDGNNLRILVPRAKLLPVSD